MAPPNTRKRKSDEMEEEAARAVTPTGSPARKKLRITQSQKQALIDNLQLEVTERARQLRAGYARQAAELRSRLERRVHRIPISVRKMTMGELVARHEAAKTTQINPRASPPKQQLSPPKPLPPLPRQQETRTKSPSPARFQSQTAAAARGKKRKSSDIQIASDKENDTADTLRVSKKPTRGKTDATTATRPASRTGRGKQTTTTSVLSPRSHNSRTLPRSPVKDYPASPAKSMIARPTTALSPLKPSSPLKTAATTASSAISASVHGLMEHARRGTAAKFTRKASKEKAAALKAGQMLPPPKPNQSAPPSPARTFSQTSAHSASTDVSTASSGTTVVKPKRGGRTAASKTAKPTAPGEQKSPVAKRGVAKAASAAKTALKRNATGANKKVVVAEPAAGRRVLRNRT